MTWVSVRAGKALHFLRLVALDAPSILLLSFASPASSRYLYSGPRPVESGTYTLPVEACPGPRARCSAHGPRNIVQMHWAMICEGGARAGHVLPCFRCMTRVGGPIFVRVSPSLRMAEWQMHQILTTAGLRLAHGRSFAVSFCSNLPCCLLRGS